MSRASDHAERVRVARRSYFLGFFLNSSELVFLNNKGRKGPKSTGRDPPLVVPRSRPRLGQMRENDPNAVGNRKGATMGSRFSLVNHSALPRCGPSEQPTLLDCNEAPMRTSK